jgi:hypothetical protein
MLTTATGLGLPVISCSAEELSLAKARDERKSLAKKILKIVYWLVLKKQPKPVLSANPYELRLPNWEYNLDSRFPEFSP